MRRAIPAGVLALFGLIALAECHRVLPESDSTGAAVRLELALATEPVGEQAGGLPGSGSAGPVSASPPAPLPGEPNASAVRTGRAAPRVAPTPSSPAMPPVAGDPVSEGIPVVAPAVDSGAPETGPEVERAVASEPPAVDPGGIATVVVTVALPAHTTGDTLDYELRLEPGFRPYFPSTGFLAVPAGESQVRVPITFGVPAGAPAGLTFAGQLRLRTPDAVTVSDSIRVSVNPVYELEATLNAASTTVEPGGSIELLYRLRSRGNAVDSAALHLQVSSGWTIRGLPSVVAVPAGDAVTGVVTVTAPRDVLQGNEQALTLVAAGAGPIARATAGVMLAAADPAFLDDWAHLPSTVFAGSSLGSAAGSSLALEGAGELTPGTRLSVSVRRREGLLLPPAFQDHMFGPRLRIGVRRAGLRASVGEIQTLGGALSAPVLSGRGVEGRVTRGPWTADLYAARPGGLGSDLAGHQLRAATSYATARGDVGVTVSSIHEEWPWTEGYRSTGAGLTYRLPDDESHDLSIQAGVLSVRPDSGEAATGPAVDARYQFHGDDARLELRGRLVPGTVLTNAALANELVANGVYDLAPGFSLKGWGQLRRAPILGSDYEPATSALFLGTRFAVGPAQIEAGGLHRRTGNGIQPTVERRTAVLGIDLPVGPLALQADALVGRYHRASESGPVRELWGGAQWLGNGHGSWARIGARYTASEYIDEQLYMDLSAATRVDRFRLEGGLATRLQADLPFEDGLSLWTSVEIEALPHTFVTAGADYQPAFGDQSWRFALGVSREFALPLPVRHTPDLFGLVFEDRNGNRLHDPGEPVLPDVRLQAGRLEIRTESDGTFAFRKTYGGELRVDPASLPIRMALPADLHLPSSGEVKIPVVEAGAVEVELFMDRNGDGLRDPAEEGAAEALVSLIDARGLARDLEADDDGRVHFGAVPPGDYTVRVLRRASGSDAGAPVERHVQVAPGQTTALTLAVPARARTIRMGAGAELGLDLQP